MMTARRCLRFGLMVGLLAILFPLAAQALPFQWRGTDSNYDGKPPFLLLRDLDSFMNFWKEHGVLEDMPFIDFSLHMVFVFCPGRSRFDYQPFEVLSFTAEGPAGVILVNLQRKQTGGFEKSPYLISILPKVVGKDVYIARVGNWRRGEGKRVPLYCFGSLGGFVTTKFAFKEAAGKPQEFLTASLPKTEPTPEDSPPETTIRVGQPGPRRVSAAATVVSVAPASPVTPPTRPATQPTIAPQAAAAQPVVAAKAPPPQKPADDGFGMLSPDTASSKPATPPASPPAKTKAESTEKKDLLSDPFQEEFNIEF